LLDDQTLPMLSFLLGEDIVEARELEEDLYELMKDLFEEGLFEPTPHIDCAYMVSDRKGDSERRYMVYLDFEMAPTDDTVSYSLVFFARLHGKYEIPILPVLVSPFETPDLPAPPLQRDIAGEVYLRYNYRMVALWQREASELLKRRWVELYALIPTMKGAAYPVLAQALRHMEDFYTGQESRLRTHLSWFETLLNRTTTVSQEDKRRIRIVLNELNKLPG
jgi:hypothetical protein